VEPSALRNKPVVTLNDLFDLPVGLDPSTLRASEGS
jgi:hypothetical protein